MRTRHISWLIGGLAVAVLAGACGSKGQASSSTAGGTIKIGASMSLTGSTAQEGQLTKQGYDLCQQVVNGKGGAKVGGKSYQLNVVYQDDTSKPDTAAQIIDQYNDQGVKLILGPYGSAATAAAAPVVERNGQVMVDSSGADDSIFSKGYRRTFAVLSPASVYVASIVDAAVEVANPKPKTVVFLSADDGFSKTATQAGITEAQKRGLQPLATEYFPSGATDVSAALTKIRDLKADLIVGSVHLAEGIAIIKQSKELGVSPAGGFGETVAPPTPGFATSLGAAANGVLGSSQWVPTVQGSDQWFGTAQDYAKTFQAKFNSAPEYHGAEATAACLALVMALQKAGSTDPAKVRDALAGLDTTSFFGPIKFDGTGKNVTKPMAVIQIQNGKPATVWPKADQAQPLIWPAAK